MYHGRGGCQGLFQGYERARGLVENYEHRLLKKFDGAQEARTSYDEMFTSGVLDLLRSAPAGKEYFVVIEGAVPGVYNHR